MIVGIRYMFVKLNSSTIRKYTSVKKKNFNFAKYKCLKGEKEPEIL